MRIIALSGPIGAGKTVLAEGLSRRLRFHHIRVRELLHEKMHQTASRGTRADLQAFGSDLEAQTRGRWLSEYCRELMAHGTIADGYVLDSFRTRQQLEGLRAEFGRKVIHVHLTATAAVLERRFITRGTGGEEAATYSEAVSHGVEAEVNALGPVAEMAVDTSPLSEADVLAETYGLLRGRLSAAE